MSKSRRNFALAKRKRGASEPHCRPLSETKNKYIEILTIDQASSTRRVKKQVSVKLKNRFYSKRPVVRTTQNKKSKKISKRY